MRSNPAVALPFAARFLDMLVVQRVIRGKSQLKLVESALLRVQALSRDCAFQITRHDVAVQQTDKHLTASGSYRAFRWQRLLK